VFCENTVLTIAGMLGVQHWVKPGAHARPITAKILDNRLFNNNTGIPVGKIKNRDEKIPLTPIF